MQALGLWWLAWWLCCFLTEPELFSENELWSVRAFTVFLFGGVWSLAVAAITFFPLGLIWWWLRWRHAFVVIAVLSAAVICAGAVRRWQASPLVASHFQKYFGASLPASAHVIRVRGTTPPDPGQVLYFIECRAEDTRALIADLGVKEVLPETGFGSDDFLIHPSPRGWPQYETWKGRRWFMRRDGQTGRVDNLMCDSSLTQVYLHRDPLGDKTDAD